MTMTATETWKSMAALGFSAYEASADTTWRLDDGKLVLVSGGIRSVDRMSGLRQLKGQPISMRLSNRGYPLIDLTDDNGKRQTRTAHSVILGTYAGLCPRGKEARHLDDNPLNARWAPGETAEEIIAAGGNLMWGTKPENNADKVRNGNRAGPRPPRECVRCGHFVEGGGRHCDACRVWLGQMAAEMLWSGESLLSVAQQLEFPSMDGLHTLAVTYGGYGQRPEPQPVPDGVRHSLLWRAIAAWRERLRDDDA